jgi:hypothetical protein
MLSVRWLSMGVLAAVMGGCSLLGLSGSSHEWMQPGRCFAYAFDNAGPAFVDSLFDRTFPDADSALVLRVEDAPGDVIFRANYKAWSEPNTVVHIPSEVAVNFAGLASLSDSPRRTRNGIEVEYPASCSGGDPAPISFSSTDAFVRVPVSPDEGDVFPIRVCGDETEGTFVVTDARRRLQVPAGTFDVFVMESEALGQREYWSEDHGLIRLDRLRADGARVGSYRLQARYSGCGES